MNAEDRAILDEVRLLHSTLTLRTVLLTRSQSNVDVFTEGMRDLGQDFCDLGTEILRRVVELDVAAATARGRSRVRQHAADQLAGLAMPRRTGG